MFLGSSKKWIGDGMLEFILLEGSGEQGLDELRDDLEEALGQLEEYREEFPEVETEGDLIKALQAEAIEERARVEKMRKAKPVKPAKRRLRQTA